MDTPERILSFILWGERRKEPFGHTSHLSRSRGALSPRRAVAQRRSRAGGLTRPLAAAIRGFGLGSGGPERCPRLAQPLRLDPCPTQIARS